MPHTDNAGPWNLGMFLSKIHREIGCGLANKLNSQRKRVAQILVLVKFLPCNRICALNDFAGHFEHAGHENPIVTLHRSPHTEGRRFSRPVRATQDTETWDLPYRHTVRRIPAKAPPRCPLSPTRGVSFLKLDQRIDVAVRAEILPQHAAVKGKPPDVMAPAGFCKLLQGEFNRRPHLRSPSACGPDRHDPALRTFRAAGSVWDGPVHSRNTRTRSRCVRLRLPRTTSSPSCDRRPSGPGGSRAARSSAA